MKIRVRFAPSPTGNLHIGNLRIALMNYLFAKQKKGSFILRIEDTDPKRNLEYQTEKIIKNLEWLSLFYNEGPYFQSKRTAIYNKKLQKLEKEGLIYRCFCKPDELEAKRKRMISIKIAPRYDRTCLKLSEEELKQNLSKKKSFIWRFKLNENKTVEINDLARGRIKFDLKNFSDFPLTREDGSFTFMFANFVDDLTMNITHVIRGEDHLTNTAGQAALYDAFHAKAPAFWHLPIICNASGKKLSKRDFGFSLNDLKQEGFLPEAINNYLGIIGSSFTNEIMSLEELAKKINFNNMHSASHIKYDVKKLKWINHKWISLYPLKKLEKIARPFLESKYPKAENLDKKELIELLKIIKTDLYILKDTTEALSFYFKEPKKINEELQDNLSKEEIVKINQILQEHQNTLSDYNKFIISIKKEAEKQKISTKKIFSYIRIKLTGKNRGLSIRNLFSALPQETINKRLLY